VIAPARVAAYQILSSVSSGSADLPTAIARARARLEDDRDRALAAEIATGTVRWRAALDHLIAEFSRRPIDRLDPEVVEILRLSVYQLLYLTRVPSSAVVDDAVDLARKAGKKSATGFVNAVLRSVSRGRQRLPWPDRPGDASDRDQALAYLSITLSHPRWLAARWLDRFGLDVAETWMRFNNSAAPLTLRANHLRLTSQELVGRLDRAGVQVHSGAFAPDALIVDAGFPLRGPGIEEGWFVVQDEASQLVALLAAPPAGARVLDACAAPGGKTTSLAAAVGDSGTIIACDVRAGRIQLLRKTIVSSGAGNVRLVQADLLSPPPFRASFDWVLVDVPCSGLGTLRRDPDIRWRRRETDLPALASAELTMLQHAAEAVRPGGVLVYATCSSEPEENEDVIDRFLAGTTGFVPLDARTVSPHLAPAVVDARGHLRTDPHLHRLEAFFAAVLERRKL
jgi:16S rRNA (cytosine967-C5)-methyltransferase